MAVKWHKTNFLGVRYREHSKRKHGIRYDRCYSIRYKLDGKDKEEVVGWSSEGISAEIASKKLLELRENSRSGDGARTLEEKRQHAERAKAQVEKERIIADSQNITLISYWETFYSSFAKSTKKASSFRAEEGHMRVWILPHLGEIPINSLSLAHWDTLVNALNASKLSPRSKEYITGTLRRLLKHAKDRGYQVDIPSSKTVGIQTVKDNRRLRILTPDEATKLLCKLGEIDVSTQRLTSFAMLTGCRLSEATSLKWGRVNISEKTIQFIDTKNSDTRICFMSDELVTLLQGIPHSECSEYVFLRKNGSPFHVNAGRSDTPHFFIEAVKQLGFNVGREVRDRVSFHTIRHTVATNLAKVLDVRSLMDVMGWKVIAMAARYIHTQEETKRAAANVLASAWRQHDEK